MTTEDLKKQEVERQQKEIQENRERLEKILPIIDAEIKALCEKHQVGIEPFLVISDLGIKPEIRIRIIKKTIPGGDSKNPYDTA